MPPSVVEIVEVAVKILYAAVEQTMFNVAVVTCAVQAALQLVQTVLLVPERV